MKKPIRPLVLYFIGVMITSAGCILWGAEWVYPYAIVGFMLLTLMVFTIEAHRSVNKLAVELEKEPAETVRSVTYAAFKRGWGHLMIGEEKRIIDQWGLFTRRKVYAQCQNPEIDRYAQQCRVAIRLTWLSFLGFFFLLFLLHIRIHILH